MLQCREEHWENVSSVISSDVAQYLHAVLLLHLPINNFYLQFMSWISSDQKIRSRMSNRARTVSTRIYCAAGSAVSSKLHHSNDKKQTSQQSLCAAKTLQDWKQR